MSGKNSKIFQQTCATYYNICDIHRVRKIAVKFVQCRDKSHSKIMFEPYCIILLYQNLVQSSRVVCGKLLVAPKFTECYVSAFL